jgi:hypothetical protein
MFPQGARPPHGNGVVLPPVQQVSYAALVALASFPPSTLARSDIHKPG